MRGEESDFDDCEDGAEGAEGHEYQRLWSGDFVTSAVFFVFRYH